MVDLLPAAGVINAIGSFTSLGGSRMDPRVTAAMAVAATNFVDLNALLHAASLEICRLARAPVGYQAHISTGAAACLALAVAGCLTQDDAARVAMLPDTRGLRAQRVLVDAGSDTRWLQSLALTGAEIRLVGTASAPMTVEQLIIELVNPAVAALVYFVGGGSRLNEQEVLAVCHAHSVPVIMDAAAQLPPVSNLWRWTELGGDVVIFSGGKQIGGPQTTGIMLGRADLIHAARANSSPNEATVCRPMKCSKEGIVGLITALRLFCTEAEAGIFTAASYNARLARVEGELALTPGILSLRRVAPGSPDIQPNWIPRLYVDLDLSLFRSLDFKQTMRAGKTAPAIYGDSVDHGNPLNVVPTSVPTLLAHRLCHHPTKSPVVVNTSDRGVIINPQTLTDQEADMVGARLHEELLNIYHLARTKAKL